MQSPVYGQSATEHAKILSDYFGTVYLDALPEQGKHNESNHFATLCAMP